MSTTNPGARPAAETDPTAAAAHVRTIFNSIAPSYDRLNHLLSFGLDRHWWRKSARVFAPILQNPEARVLDICCGTGDMTAALLALRPNPHESVISTGAQRSGETWCSAQPITGLDFSSEMLARARAKFPTANILWLEADAMHLPYPDSTFDLVTSAFGFRNLTDYAAGLREIHRVLRPGGRIGILECNQPRGLSGAAYNLYFRHVLPLIGGLVSGDRAAYRWLPASVARFPRPPQMLALLSAAGFSQPAWDGYLLHAAGLYRAIK